MKPKTRFIQSVITTAQKNETVMPWARGARREGFVAYRRQVAAPVRRIKTA